MVQGGLGPQPVAGPREGVTGVGRSQTIDAASLRPARFREGCFNPAGGIL